MPATIDTAIAVGIAGVTNFSGGGTPYYVRANNGALYFFYKIDTNNFSYKKSTDYGKTWAAPVTVATAAQIAWTVWYDRWSNISADLIHIAYTDATADDTFYRTLDTADSDTMTAATVIFAGGSAISSGHLSLCRARGGNVYCKTDIDGGTEAGFARLLNADVPNGAWAARTINEAAAAGDMIVLVPGFAADNQDIIGLFWDSSATEVSRQLYDDSLDSWSETSIATSMTPGLTNNTSPFISAAVDLTNSQIIMVAWSAEDTVNADLRCWKITDSSITEVTNVVLNSGGNQALAAVALDTGTGYWYMFYGGKSDGTETFATGAATISMNLYMKVSTDSGTTWGSETKVSNSIGFLSNVIVCPRFTGNALPTWNDEDDGLHIMATPSRTAQFTVQVG